MADDFVNRRDRTQGTVELGPRALALLRRAVALLEEIAGTSVDDPGKSTEDETVTWPDG